jgi:hypothetical protein
MLPLLRKTGVIDDPGHYRAVLLHSRKHPTTHLLQYRGIAPRRIGHQMVQGLVHSPHIMGRQPCGHRLNTLALARQPQAGAVAVQRPNSVGMPCGLRQAIEIGRKASLLWAWCGQA